MNLRDQRPKRTKPAKLTRDQRIAISVRGAQYSPTLGQWIGFLFTGVDVITFEPRTNRARALQDAHAHYDRIFHEERPGRRWSPSLQKGAS
jgi:hypothetical protein